MIEQIVHKLLRTSAPITAKVGETGVHYGQRPQGSPLPALVIERGSRRGRPTMKSGGGVAWGFVRVTVLADSYLGTSDLAELVRNRLSGFAGDVTITLEDDSNQTLRVGYIHWDDESDIPSDHRDGQGNILTHGTQIDSRYQHTMPAPTLV